MILIEINDKLFWVRENVSNSIPIEQLIEFKKLWNATVTNNVNAIRTPIL